MSCAAAVKAALENVEGCVQAKADWEKGWAWAKYDPAKTNPEELVEAINENTAFEAELSEKTEKEKNTVRGLLEDPVSHFASRCPGNPR